MSGQPRKRRMLVITFSYAPMLNARAFRWTALAGYFAARGWEVDVVTSWHAEARDEGPVRVHRAGWTWVERLRGTLRRQRGQTAGGPAPRSSALRRLRDALWKPLYWPDSSVPWYWPARRLALRLVAERRHDAIVSVAPTFTGVLVGRRAKAAHPAARWLLDVGDPFSLQADAAPNNRVLYGALNRRAEGAALARADAVSVTTEQTAARYREAFPQARSKIAVIPPLFSMEGAPAEPLFAADGVLRLVYVGTLYRGLREPEFLLTLFEAVRARRPGAELHFFGDSHQFAQALSTRPGVRVHGTVSRETIARAMAGASVLVNLGNRSADQLPSKLVEYAAAGRPILNVAPRRGDLSAAMLEGHPDALTLYEERAPSPQQLSVLDSFLAGLPRRADAGAIEAWLAPYRLPRIGAAYEALLA